MHFEILSYTAFSNFLRVHILHTSRKQAGIVGKGLIFDTRGYTIKTAMIKLMKSDCGVATVLGAARAVGDFRSPDVEAHFVLTTWENMSGPRVLAPSNVLVSSNNRMSEVLNTNAKGTLTLADALVFVDVECGCESMTFVFCMSSTVIRRITSPI